MKKIYLLLCFILLMPIFCYGQSSGRIIDFFAKADNLAGIVKDKDGKTSFSKESVLALVEIKVEGKTVKPGEYFDAADDWLKTLTVKLKNISGKPISRITLTLGIPEAKRKGGFASSALDYSSFDANTGDQNGEKLVMPGEIIELNQERYEAIKFTMKQTGISTINQINIVAASVYFKDGSYWSSNRLPVSQ